jgi:hypothetical protein
MKPTDSFAPWMGKRLHVPTIPAGLFFTRQEHFEDSVEKAQEGGNWIQDELPFDEAPTTPEPISDKEPTTSEPTSEESPMSTHPITGEQVPTVPVKRSKYKQTAPGTKPKRKKKK